MSHSPIIKINFLQRKEENLFTHTCLSSLYERNDDGAFRRKTEEIKFMHSFFFSSHVFFFFLSRKTNSTKYFSFRHISVDFGYFSPSCTTYIQLLNFKRVDPEEENSNLLNCAEPTTCSTSANSREN